MFPPAQMSKCILWEKSNHLVIDDQGFFVAMIFVKMISFSHVMLMPGL